MEVEVVDWDLHAVVRGCCTTNSKQPPSHAPPPPPLPPLDEFSNKHLPPVQPQREELFDLFRPFFCSPVPPVEHPEVSSNVLPPPPRNNFTPRSKRRKNQFKKVCEVPAEGLASDDKWSWRKYGQKPIKGSPYPRGYYRCSSSKGCPARKQVERSRTDPNMFIVTYTSEHNHPAPTHRNSLAGISRHQSNSNNKLSVSSSKQGTSSSSVPTSPSDDDDDDEMQQSIKTEDDHQYQLDEILMHQEREESGGGNGEEVLLLDEDFFDGLDEIANRSACGSDMVC